MSLFHLSDEYERMRRDYHRVVRRNIELSNIDARFCECIERLKTLEYLAFEAHCDRIRPQLEISWTEEQRKALLRGIRARTLNLDSWATGNWPNYPAPKSGVALRVDGQLASKRG